MHAESAQTLPKTLPGVIRLQWVRCGKPGCRCAAGQLHGPYPYRFWREGARLRKAYVRPADLEQVRAACQARASLREQLRDGWRQWRRIRDLLREVERR
jgi:hypothetical protein